MRALVFHVNGQTDSGANPPRYTLDGAEPVEMVLESLLFVFYILLWKSEMVFLLVFFPF